MVITFYRCHPFAALRGGTITRVIGKLLGCQVGMSNGKGGSTLTSLRVRCPLLLSILPHLFLPPASLVHERTEARARNVSPGLPSEECTPSPRRMASRPTLLNTGMSTRPLAPVLSVASWTNTLFEWPEWYIAQNMPDLFKLASLFTMSPAEERKAVTDLERCG
jgi:hypothetical protein